MQANLVKSSLSSAFNTLFSQPSVIGSCGITISKKSCRSPIIQLCGFNCRSFTISSHCLKSSGSGSDARNGECFDFTIIGGGIVGAATAMELSKKYPKLKMAILEKEKELGAHQSGHNSGVIHAGIYYKPGSLKAKLCVDGLHLSYKYLDEHRIPYKKCGKLIVAVSKEEIPRLMDLYKRGQQNNVPNLQLIGQERIKEFEPYCEGLMAIWSPETGIVDWGRVTRSYGENFRKSSGKIYTNFPVVKFQRAAEGSEYPVLVFSESGKEDEVHVKVPVYGNQRKVAYNTEYEMHFVTPSEVLKRCTGQTVWNFDMV